MQKRFFKAAAFHLFLAGNFFVVLSGGVSGLSVLHSGSASRTYSHRFGPRIEINIPALHGQAAGSRRGIDRVTGQTAALIRTSAAFKKGCLAGSSADQLLEAVEGAANDYGVPAELLISMIITESNCRTHSVSPRGARGLMQLAPATAKSLGVDRPHHVVDNVRGGARYIAQMLDRFDGDLNLALAAYNAGPANVIRYGNIPPFPETRGYVSKVVRLYTAVLFHTTGKAPYARAA